MNKTYITGIIVFFTRNTRKLILILYELMNLSMNESGVSKMAHPPLKSAPSMK